VQLDYGHDLSPPQGLLSEGKKREGGALGRENGSAGNDGMRENAGAFSFFPLPSVSRAL